MKKTLLIGMLLALCVSTTFAQISIAVDDGRRLRFENHFSTTVKFIPKEGIFTFDRSKEVVYDEHSLGMVSEGEGPGIQRHYYAIKVSDLKVKTITITFIRTGMDDATHVIQLDDNAGYLEFSFESISGDGDFTGLNQGKITFKWTL